MKRIKVLNQLTANQIAAGEVVERPASVVKELVENALDAGASAITIETKGGGLESIRVTDNGCGIPAEDVETAFLRHATSKISTADDLSHIETLGFRGEALASIAAVSHVTLKTCTAEEEAGTLLRISGGEVKENRTIGTPQGTAIEVENLFFNVPARLKFMKSARAESAYISDYISRMLMARATLPLNLCKTAKPCFKVRETQICRMQSTVYTVQICFRICVSCFMMTDMCAFPALSQRNRRREAIGTHRAFLSMRAILNRKNSPLRSSALMICA